MGRCGALAGLRVVELGRRPAAQLAGVLLADHGADVLALGPPAGWRGRGKRRAPRPPDEQLAALLDRADLLVDDSPPGEIPGGARAGRPGLIHLRLPGWHDRDPRRGEPDYEAAISAAAGLYEVPLGRGPAYTPLDAAGLVAALYGVDAALAALIARERDGLGQEIAVPVHDAAVAAQELAALFLVDPPKVWDTLRWVASPFIAGWRCGDGRWVFLHAGMPAHAARLVEVLEEAGCRSQARALRAVMSPATRADPSAPGGVREARLSRRLLAAAFRSRPAADWERRLSEAGLCAALCREGAEWIASEHARAAQQVVAPEGRGEQPGLLVELSGTPGAVRRGAEAAVAEVLARWPERPPVRGVYTEAPPLAGLRVLDLTQVIAGPVAARTLAELGADVLRVENPHLSAGWVEPFHLLYNRGKRSAVVDLKDAAGREALLAHLEGWPPDVVIENLRSGAAERLGLGEAVFRERFPGVIYVHLTAFGERGPWGDWPGWEQTAQAAAGIQVRYGGADHPELYPLPLNDLGTGLAGAFGALLALYSRHRTGAGQRVSACLTATATWLQSSALFGERAAAGALGAGPLERFYRARDGWMLLALEDAHFPELARVCGLEALAGRDPARSAELLAELLAEATVETWRFRLRAAGLAERIAAVPWGRRAAVLRDPALAARGLVAVRRHEGIGAATEVGCPVQLSRTPARHLPPARPRGADTAALSSGAAPLAPPALPVGVARWRSEASWLLRQVIWGAYLIAARSR